MMLADDKKELVFLYGAQCRDGMMDSKLDRAEQVGVGIAPGSLLSVSGLPVMVSGDGRGKVRGEIYRVDPKLLGELDAIMAETARIVGNGNCRRKRITVIEVKYGRPAMEVWGWQWEDLEGPQELITSGDWIDRQTAPWFTVIALACLLAGLLIPGVFAALVTPSLPVPVAF
ncbi:gamma-glutamylcyclotransferase family protein [Luteolibacter luteus]|uniref:Gamma-glutamylcyclotransferase n=1 Tax=Luteolibacter luteus TaxID=2728835 RepID=A0A858REZ3_9BACT|nr:gamma-glutamylcyclotransferase family protein [Luteolibacter luteus]QJE95295.1 gamma-glutamylcyclotransferase [Luteolibacter luteus]